MTATNEEGEAEKQDMVRDLGRGNVPVFFEHNPKLRVGSVRGATLHPDGSVSVIGRLDHDGLAGEYVRTCLGGSSELYRGLSLSHLYTCEKGVDCKVPLEVSICEQGRRPKCRISRTTASSDYKCRTRRVGVSMSETVVEKASVTPEAAPVLENTDALPSGNINTPTKSEVEAMQVALETEEKRAELEKKLKASQEELQNLRDAVNKQASQEMKKLKDKGDAIAEALRKQWTTAMPDVSFEHASSLIDAVRKDDPKLGHELLELIECASNRSVQLQQNLVEAQGKAKRDVLEERYKQMLLSNGSATAADTTPTTSAVAAAAPAPTQTPAASASASAVAAAANNPYAANIQTEAPRACASAARFQAQASQIQAAFNDIAGGNAASRMRAVAEMASNKRRRYY